LSNKEPAEQIQIINKIAKTEKYNKTLKKLNDLFISKNIPIREQKKLIENFDVTTSLAPRINLLNKSLAKFKKLLIELKKDPKKREADVHKFIFENYWLLGIEYYSKPCYSSIDEFGDRTDKQVLQEDKTKPDFIIESIDGSKSVIFFELEAVNALIIHKKGKSETGLLARDAFQGINQAVRYTIQSKLKGKHPKGKVIIGSIKKSKKWKERLVSISEYLGNIEILTYDDIVEKAQKTIHFFENYQKKILEDYSEKK
jgi:hypothetical protein